MKLKYRNYTIFKKKGGVCSLTGKRIQRSKNNIKKTKIINTYYFYKIFENIYEFNLTSFNKKINIDLKGLKQLNYTEGPYMGLNQFIILYSNYKNAFTKEQWKDVKKNKIPLFWISTLADKFLYNIIISHIETNISSKNFYCSNSLSKSKFILSLKTKSIVQLPSGEFKLLSNFVFSHTGYITNIKKKLVLKATKLKYKNRKSTVRGVAMNALDHPHGGGTSKSFINKKTFLSPWGRKNYKKKKINLYI